MLKTGTVFTQVDLWLGLSYCDGKWKKVTVNKEGSVVSASMDELREQTLEPHVQQLKVNSPVYIGGIPPEIQSFYKELGPEQGKVTPRPTYVFQKLVPCARLLVDALLIV